MKLIPLLITLLFSNSLYQQNFTIHFNQDFHTEEKESHGFTMTYSLDSNYVATRLGSYTITFPKNFRAVDTAFASEYFVGFPGEISRGIGLLIANYKNGLPLVYVDQNNNLDFSDDGDPIPYSVEDSAFVLRFHNQKNKQALFEVKYFLPNDTEENLESLEEFFRRNELVESGVKMLKARYWLYTKRLNNRIVKTSLNGDSVKAAIMDYNCNGYFNDIGKDRVFIAKPNITYTSNKSSGAFTYWGDTTFFSFKGQVYEMIEVDSLGRSISFQKTDKHFEKPLASGDLMPGFWLKTIDQKDSIYLPSLLDGQKYLLIDVWGNWCKGCHSSAETIKNIAEEFSKKLKVLGVNSGEPAETVKKFTEKYGQKWTQTYATKEFIKTFRVDAYPSFILVDPEGKIISLRAFAGEIEKLMKLKGGF